MSNIKVEYVNHSGFFVSLENCGLLFDFYRAERPPVDPQKPLYVFCSHSHSDHCDPKALALLLDHENVTFVMADEIRHGEAPVTLPEEILRRTVWLEADEHRHIGEIEVETLTSTDSGVAFLVQAGGLSIYHAGDLNDWYWAAESEADRQWVAEMTQWYHRIIEPLRGRHFHLAFVPVDPRLAEPFRGLDELLQQVQVDWLFPMHMWKRYHLIDEWLQTPAGRSFAGQTARIEHRGQWFEAVSVSIR